MKSLARISLLTSQRLSSNRHSSSIILSRFQFLETNSHKSVHIQIRTIKEDSWARDGLLKAGEKLESVERKPLTEVTPELLRSEGSDEVKRLCDEILALNVVEVNQLLFRLQTRLGIPDAALYGNVGGGGGGGGNDAAAAPAAAVEPVKEKEIFDIKLAAVDQKNKIKVIKEVRTITNLGLKEAKELVEKAPVVIKTGLKKDEAEQIKKVLLEAGAEIEVL